MMVARLRSPRSEEETRIRWCGWPVMGQMGGARQLSVGSTPALLRLPEMGVRYCPPTGASASFIRGLGGNQFSRPGDAATAQVFSVGVTAASEAIYVSTVVGLLRANDCLGRSLWSCLHGWRRLSLRAFGRGASGSRVPGTSIALGRRISFHVSRQVGTSGTIGGILA